MTHQPASFRLKDDDILLIRQLEDDTGLSRVDVVRLALRLLARTWKAAPALGVQGLADEVARVKNERGKRTRGS
jgi:hypothetical protein